MHLLSSNYTVADLVSGLIATLLFIPILSAPGYVIAWFSDLFRFRTLSAPWRLLVSIPLSVALCPVLTYWIGSVVPWRIVWIFYAACSLIWLLLLGGAWKHERWGAWMRAFRDVPKWGWLVPILWLGVTLFSLVDLQIGDRLYFSVAAYDHSLRAAFTDAITRSGVHPLNPLYDLGSPAPLRYHFFWYLLCSQVARMGNSLIDSAQAMIGSVVWCGWATIALIPLYFRFFYSQNGPAFRRRVLIGIALLTVTGLDVIPTVLIFLHKHYLYADMEWWNGDQVTSWMGSLLWVPHHVASFVAGMMGFLMTWYADSLSSPRGRFVCAVLAGAAFATCAGTSVYVALVLTVFLGLWTVVTFMMGRRQYSLVLVIAGAVAVVLVVPYLMRLLGPGGGGGLVRVAVRHFDIFDRRADAAHIGVIAKNLLRLIILPVNYLLELGVFLVAGLVYIWNLRRRSLDGATLAALLMAATSIVLCTFVRSAVVNNDLGMRGFLLAQFILLLWAADLFASWQETTPEKQPFFPYWWRRHPVWAALILLGLTGTLYSLTILRFHGLLADNGLCAEEFSPDQDSGRRTLALRQAYDKLHQLLKANAIVQNNPSSEYEDFAYGLYAQRQTAAFNRGKCGTEFGGDPKTCDAIYPELRSIFDGSDPSVNEVASLCKRLSISAVVLKDIDPAWNDRQGWAWHTQPAIANQYVRVYLFDLNPVLSQNQLR